MEKDSDVCGQPITSNLGKGGYGVVFSTKKGALKLISKISISELTILNSFNYKYLSHATKIYDYEECEGKGIGVEMSKAISDLSASLEFERSLRDKLTLLYQVSLGLQKLHEKNILHLDIKPANILLFEDQTTGKVYAVLSDFGLSLFLENIYSETKELLKSGTTYYMRGVDVPLNYACDIYSLAILILEVLSEKKIYKIVPPYITNKDARDYFVQNYGGIGSKKSREEKRKWKRFIIETISFCLPSIISKTVKVPALRDLLSMMIMENPIDINGVVSFFSKMLKVVDNNTFYITPNNITYNKDNIIPILNLLNMNQKKEYNYIDKTLIDLLYRFFYSKWGKNVTSDLVKLLPNIAIRLSKGGSIEIDNKLSLILKSLNWVCWRDYYRESITPDVVFSPKQYIEFTNWEPMPQLEEQSNKEEIPSLIYTRSSLSRK